MQTGMSFADFEKIFLFSLSTFLGFQAYLDGFRFFKLSIHLRVF